MSTTLDNTSADEVVTGDFATLDEVHTAALAALDPAVRDFLEGGAGAETTLRRNRSAFEQWAFVPRVMNGLPMPSTATTFLGIDLALPVLTAPFGADNLFHPDGQIAVARANQAAGTASIVPEAGSHPVEDVARAAPMAAAIGQFHPLGSEASFLKMRRRYEQAGYKALCLTCDCPTGGWRERNLRNRFSPDENAIGGNYPAGSSEFGDVFGQLFDQSAPVWSWDKLGGLLADSPLPWMAKGIMTVDDAEAAVAAGASALLVSNHGGRQLDGQRSSLGVLPEIRDAVGPDVGIALDSGVRRGADIVKAVALGADVVVLGRLAAYGLATGGQAGVARVLELLAAEVTTILTLLGRGSITDLDRTAVVRAEAF